MQSSKLGCYLNQIFRLLDLDHPMIQTSPILLTPPFPYLAQSLLTHEVSNSMPPDVTPVFLAPNKSPNKSRVFPKLSSWAQLPPSNPWSPSPLSPTAHVPRIPPAPPAPGPALTRAFPAPRSATVPGILRTPRSRRPVPLAITAVPKITPTPGIVKPRKNPSP
jgi:hypothetical protein